MDDLEGIIRVCEDLNNEARSTLIQQHNAENEDDLNEDAVAKLSKQSGTTAVYVSNRSTLLEDLRRTDLDLTVMMRKDREISGAPSLVLKDVDARKTTDISINQIGLYRGSVGLSLNFLRNHGCRVTLRSDDKKWVSHARTELERALLKNRPWYWWLRKYWVLSVLFYAAFLIGFLPLLFQDPSSQTTLTVFLAAVVVPNGLPAVLQLVIPAFELRESGQQARGSVVIATIIAVVGWLGSIFLPQMLF